MSDETQSDLQWLAEIIQTAIADVARYQPGLLNENPASCVQIFVMQPAEASSELGDFVFAASPAEFYVMMRGREVLGRPTATYDIRGIFPLNEPDEALCLAKHLLEEAAVPRCRKCGKPYADDVDGSPGVLQHQLEDGSGVDYDTDENHPPVPEEED